MTIKYRPKRPAASGLHVAPLMIAGLLAIVPFAADCAMAQQYRQLREPGQGASREADIEEESLESPTRAAGSERRLRTPGSRTTTSPGSTDRASSDGGDEEQDTTDLGRIDNRISSRIDTRIGTRLSTRIDNRIGTRSRSDTQDGTAQVTSDMQDTPSDAAPEG